MIADNTESYATVRQSVALSAVIPATAVNSSSLCGAGRGADEASSDGLLGHYEPKKKR